MHLSQQNPSGRIAQPLLWGWLLLWLLFGSSGCSWLGNRSEPALAGETGPAATSDPESITLAEKRLLDLHNQKVSLLERYRNNPEGTAQDSMEMQVVNLVNAWEAYLVDNKEDTTARLLLAKFLVEVGQFEEAIRHFLIVDQQDPDIPVVKQQIGNYLAETGRYMAALPYFINAVDLAPDEPLYYYQLAGLLYEYRSYYVEDGFYTREELESEMLDALSRAVQLDPDNLQYWRQLGELFYELEAPDWEAALNVWDKLLARVDNPLDRQAIELHRARVLHRMGQDDRALEIAMKIVEPSLQISRRSLLQEIQGEPISRN